jgi:hypothetical protein
MQREIGEILLEVIARHMFTTFTASKQLVQAGAETAAFKVKLTRHVD